MKKIKTILIVMASLVVGGVIGAVLVSVQWNKFMSRFVATALTEMAVDARQIRGGVAEATLERKMDAIPGLVQQLNSVHRRYLPESVFNGALWSVSRFYEDIETGVPASIQPIMESIPPRPKTSCELTGMCAVHPEDNGDAEPSPGAYSGKAADGLPENAQE